MALTKRQKEVLDYLVAFETKHGYAPSFEEIGKGLKLTSLATVHKPHQHAGEEGFYPARLQPEPVHRNVQLPRSCGKSR